MNISSYFLLRLARFLFRNLPISIILVPLSEIFFLLLLLKFSVLILDSFSIIHAVEDHFGLTL